MFYVNGKKMGERKKLYTAVAEEAGKKGSGEKLNTHLYNSTGEDEMTQPHREERTFNSPHIVSFLLSIFVQLFSFIFPTTKL